VTKTRVNPIINKIVLVRTTRRYTASSCSTSVKDTPARFDRKAGTKTTTQGEKNDINPAIKAAGIVILSSIVNYLKPKSLKTRNRTLPKFYSR